MTLFIDYGTIDKDLHQPCINHIPQKIILLNIGDNIYNTTSTTLTIGNYQTLYKRA
jgi:hypothetical protein